jgi:hypothetical protein
LAPQPRTDRPDKKIEVVFQLQSPIYIDHLVIPQYHAFITASFSNFSVPTVSQSALRYGTMHVAVGFVDLAQLLDCKYEVGNSDNTEPITFYGYKSSAYAIAKSLIVWDVLQNDDLNVTPSQVVQVWYSCVEVWYSCVDQTHD